MQPLLTSEEFKEIKRFNQNVAWLKIQAIKSQPSTDVWGSYEDAAKILDRSKQWYKGKRLGYINEFKILVPAELEKGRDWRLVGNKVEYRLDSIRALKEKISLK